MATAYQNTYGLNPRSNLYDRWITPTLQSPSYSITPLTKSPSLYTYSEAQPKSGDNKLSTTQIISTVKREMAADEKFGHLPAKYNSYLSSVIANNEVGKADHINKRDTNSDLYRFRKDRIDEELGHYGNNSYTNETATIKTNSKSVASPSNILKNTIKNEHDLDFKLGVDSPYAIQRDWRTTHAHNELPYSLSPTKKQYLGSSYSDKARLPETELGVLPFERSHSNISALRSNIPDQNAVAGRIRELGITSLGLRRANTFHGTSTNSGTAVNSLKSQHDSVTPQIKTTPTYTQIDSQDKLNSVDSKKVFDNVDAILKRQQDITKATNLSSLESKYKMADHETTEIPTTSSAPWHANHDISNSKSSYLTAHDKQPPNYNTKSNYLPAYDKQPVTYSTANRLDTADLARAKLLRNSSAHIGAEHPNNEYLRSRDAKSSLWKLEDYMFQLDARENQRVDTSKLDYSFQKSNSNVIDQYSANSSVLSEDSYNKYRYPSVGKNSISPEHKSSYSGNIKTLSSLDKLDYDHESGPTSNKRDGAYGVTTSNNMRNDVLSCLTSTVSSGGFDRVNHISPRYDTIQPSPSACKVLDYGKANRNAPKSILKKTSAYDIERNQDYLDIIHATGPSQFPALDGTLRRKLRKRVTFDSALHYS